MLWLAAHMWFLLLLTFLIGLGVGWWVWGARANDEVRPTGEAPMGTLDSDPQPPDENRSV